MPEPNAPGTGASGKSSLFAKPDLDAMGTSGDHSERAGAVPRSLFRKQDHREAHGADYGTPNDERSLFRKNTLDEMTVGRTEKPVGKTPPKKPEPTSGKRFSPLLEGQAERAASPSTRRSAPAQDEEPVKRHRPGLGSYEDPADERQRNRRPKKTGRPGR